MIRLIGLDLDGTILNSLEDLTDAVNYALKKENLKFQSIDKVKEYIGDGVFLLLQRASSITDDVDRLDRLKKYFDEYYSEHYCDKSILYDGIEKFLLKLKNMNINIIVYSNKPDKYVKVICKKLLGNIGIYKAIGQCSEYQKKPNVDHFKKYQNELNVLNNETMYVGDSDVDIKTAKNAGVLSVGVTWGYRDIDVILKENPDYIVNSIDELEKIVFDN